MTATRCDFRGALTVTTATLVGSMCVIDASTTTVSSGLYIEGWFDPTDSTRGGHDWVLIGGAYTLSSSKTYLTATHFYKLSGATLTVAGGVTLTLVDADLDGTVITTVTDLVNTNNGTVSIGFTVNIRVLDEAGAALASATVIISDRHGNVLATDTTNASGDIAEQVIVREVFGTGADINYPEHVQIEKNGYRKQDYRLDINRELDIITYLGAPGGGAVGPDVIAATVPAVVEAAK
jgi:hypothetical protein